MQHALRFSVVWRALAWCWVAAVIWLTLTSTPPAFKLPFPYFDKLEHFGAYIFLMTWFIQAYREEQERWGIAAFLIALGVVLELLQGLGGTRSFEIADMAANCGGVVLGLLLAYTRIDRFAIVVERTLLREPRPQ